MLKLSDLLKGKRRELGLEIKQVSEHTKIPRQMLRALEEADYEVFSSEVHLKGFLRNYAKFLGVDIDKALAIYRRDRENSKEGSLKDIQKPIEENKPIVTPGRLVFFITIVIVFLVVTFVVIQINKIIQPPSLEISAPVQCSAPCEEYAEVNSDTIAIYGKIEVGSKLLINGSEVTTNNLQEFRVDDFKLNPGSNEIYILAESYYFAKTSEVKLTVMANYEEDNEEEIDDSGSEEEDNGDGTGDNSEKMQIEFEVVTEEAWTVVTIDGVKKLETTVKVGEKKKFEALETFTIYSPRSQLFKLTINGEEYTFESQAPALFKLVNGSVVQE